MASQIAGLTVDSEWRVEGDSQDVWIAIYKKAAAKQKVEKEQKKRRQ